MLSRGDINIYFLFVERSHRLLTPTGLVGLLVPSGIASDLGSSLFFSMIMRTRRLASLIDFFNKRDNDKLFFSSGYYRFKFCLYVGGGASRSFDKCEFAFFVQNPMEITSKAVKLDTTIIVQMNPNSGTSPIFRSKRDAVLAIRVYEHVPVLINRSKATPVEVWPARYSTMFHMTNDSHNFKIRAQLEADGFYPTARNRLRKGDAEFVPLYEGKLVQSFDHRAASVVVDTARLHRPGHSVAATLEQHQDPYWFPEPQFWIDQSLIDLPADTGWSIGFKDVTSTTNARTMIAAALPRAASGNTLPLLVSGIGGRSPEYTKGPDDSQYSTSYKHWAPLLLANLNSIPLDYFARQKVQGNHLNWYIVEQLPIVPELLYTKRIGRHYIQDLVGSEVLRLTYTAWDMQSFASEMGYDGPPFEWDEEDRLHRRSRLDALFFLLYEITDENDVRYILDTFPIVRHQDEAQVGRYRTCDLIIAYLRAFKAGDVETRVAV